MIDAPLVSPRIRDLSAFVGDVERGAHTDGITLVPLVQEWIGALEDEEWADLDLAGLFFALASRLVLLKLRLLLPTVPEDEHEVPVSIHDLTAIEGLSQTLAVLEAHQEDYALCTTEYEGPSRRQVLADMDSLAALLRAAGEIVRAIQQAGSHRVAVEFMSAEEARARVSAMLARGRMTLSDLLGEATSIGEVLSYFLALLELIRLELCAFWIRGSTVWLEPMKARPPDRVRA